MKSKLSFSQRYSYLLHSTHKEVPTCIFAHFWQSLPPKLLSKPVI